MLNVENIPAVDKKENELDPRVLSINALNPWSAHDSKSRETMFSASNLSQFLVAEGATVRRCQTGVESELAKATFNYTIPCDASIIRVIPKFSQTVGGNSIQENPVSLVIFENIETKEVGIIEAATYSSYIDTKHQHFGFRYQFTDIMESLRPGLRVKKGTCLGDSPLVKRTGGNTFYNYGLETNVAYMGIPGVIQDGIVVSESYAKRLTSTGIEKRTASWGKKWFPLNLYGDENTYKPFPDIGDTVREDNLLFALRQYDELLNPVQMTPIALQQPDYVFDKLIYAVPGAKIIDIDVLHGNRNKLPSTPTGMEAHAEKYSLAQKQYYVKILEVYAELSQQRRKSLKITPEFHRLVVTAMNYVGFENNPAIAYIRKKDFLHKRQSSGIIQLYAEEEIDDWRVTATFQYPVVATVGFKLTDTHGGKGVICSVWKDEDMPVDEAGNRAEVIMDDFSVIKRMNLGRVYEQYINACSRDVTNRVRDHLDKGGDIEQAWNYLMGYYRTVSPKMGELFIQGEYEGTHEEHVQSVYRDGVYLWMPTDNPADSPDIIRLLNRYFPPTFTPVTFKGGNKTSRPVLIGSVYMLLLEKTGADWSGASSTKLQHFGIPAKSSGPDKFELPGKNSPVRILGETEVRLLNSIVGSDVVADYLDQSNSPATHQKIIDAILESDSPTRIKKIVDRHETPIGHGRHLQYVNHVLECAGVRFKRVITDPLRARDIEGQSLKHSDP